MTKGQSKGTLDFAADVLDVSVSTYMDANLHFDGSRGE